MGFHYLIFHKKIFIFAGHSKTLEDKIDKLLKEMDDLQSQLEASELENEKLKVSCKDHPRQDNKQNYG